MERLDPERRTLLRLETGLLVALFALMVLLGAAALFEYRADPFRSWVYLAVLGGVLGEVIRRLRHLYGG